MCDNKIFVVSGPSGVGKDTVINEVLKLCDDLEFSISSISRAIRPGESEGEKYHFVTKEIFEEGIKNNEFLEYAEYCGNYYGTPKKPVEKWLDEGKKVLIEIDVQGARKLMKIFPNAHFVFIMPTSIDVLRQRLTERHTDSPEVINKRIMAATLEIESALYYNYIIINKQNHLDESVKEFCNIINGCVMSDTEENRKKIINEVLKNA